MSNALKQPDKVEGLSPLSALAEAGINPRWATEIVRQCAAEKANGLDMIEAGVPTALACLIVDEAKDARISALAGRSIGRAARFEELGLSTAAAVALAAVISEGTR